MKCKWLKTSNSLDKLKRYHVDFMHKHEKINVFNLDLKMSTFSDSLISTGSLFHLFAA